jgi:hypothetical protein
VPYGTDSRLDVFQAINCLDFGELSRVATIIWSLRDNTPTFLGRRVRTAADSSQRRRTLCDNKVR